MSAQLDLGASELLNIETSWSQVENKVNYQRIDFISRIYSKMISANRKFRSTFNDDLVLNHHIAMFSDLLNFTISYLNEPKMLDEFMYQFNIENAIFTSVAVTYLEEMGPAIIDTIKEYLPGLSSEVENSWVKLYVYIANSLLQYSDSDDDDDDDDEMEEASDEMVAPLNIRRPSPQYEEIQEPQIVIQKPQPRMTKPSAILDPSKSIQFHLNSNEKYKGFRRSVEYQSAEPISVAIPELNNFQKVHQPVAAASASSNMSSSLKSMLASTSGTNSPFITPPSTPFDPRKTRRGVQSSASSIHEDQDNFVAPIVPVSKPVIQNVEQDDEEFTPVRSSRRNSLSEGKKLPEIPSLLAKLEQHQQALISSEEEEDYEEPIAAPIEKFDPRSRKGHKRSNSVHIPSPESSEVDEQEEFEYMRSTSNNFGGRVEQAQINIEPPSSIPERSLSRGGLTGGTFDYNSFGLKGLAPIVEADFDDNASSKYGDNDDGNSTNYGADESNKSVTDEEETSSRSSSLSLHNSDYKSSISSGTESANSSPTTDLKNKFSRQQVEYHKPQQPVYRQQLQQHYQAATSSTSNLGSLNRTYCSSTPSLLMGKTGDQFGTKRASMGFMRSSFVLKKEMETLGYNIPENISMSNNTSNVIKKSSPSMASTSNFSEQYNQRASTTISLPRNFNSNKFSSPVIDEDDSFDMLNSFNISNGNKKNGLNYKSRVIEPPAEKEKMSFKKRLSSFFGGSSSKSSTSTASSTRASSTRNSSTSTAGVNSVMSSNSSMRTSSTRATSTASAGSINSKPISQYAPPPATANIPRRVSQTASSGYSMTSKVSHPSVMSDGASINSVETRGSSLSGFSIFSKKNKDITSQYRLHGTKSKNGGKYKVQSTPYDLELFRKGHKF